LRFGFAAYERHDLYLAKRKIVDARVFKGVATSVEVGLADPIDMVLPKGAGKSLQATVQLIDPVVAPLETGQLLGTLTVQMDGTDLLSRPLVTLHAVPEGTWFNRMADVVRLWFH
jgi:D-alanyl-D-alanine carboxypeptidase (penicillin-binding protein 5/6)